MTTSKEIYIKLPFMSCSVNKAYAGMSRRFKSKDYKKFEKIMELHFKEELGQYRPNNHIRVMSDTFLCVEYTFHFPLFYKNGKIRKKDVSNYEKTLSDCLSHHIEGFKDEHIVSLTLKKEDSETEFIEVKIKEL